MSVGRFLAGGTGNIIGFDDGIVENLRTHNKEWVGRRNYNTIGSGSNGKKVTIFK